MSKMDNMRAMREAKFERTTKAAAQRARPATLPTTPISQAETAPVSRPAGPEAENPDYSLCGHRAISGRTCTRERGHDAKSHRYS